MTKRIDHAAESERIAEHLGEDIIAQEGITDATIIATQLDALRHATLALVEQQRIANLIALSQGTFPNGQRYTDRLHYPLDEYSVAMNDDIRQGLGL